MEKENQKVERTNADRERKKKLTNAILMAFVCILMMSGATYAWFTMSNTAKVTSLKLNVASEGNLYIGKSEELVNAKDTTEVTWFGEGKNSDTSTIETLYPCTLTKNNDDTKTLKKPIYTSETVVGSVEDIDTSDTSTEKDMYYLEQDFWLLMDEGSVTPNKVYNVSLAQNNTSSNEGTYFTCAETSPNPAYCVRMSFEINNEIVAIYEPNYGESNGGNAGTDYATSTITAVESTHKQSASGTFTSTTDDSTNKAPVTGDSDALFTITGNEPTKVTIRVWFEGTDTDCQNKIDTKNIVGQLKFVANKTTKTASTSGN